MSRFQTADQDITYMMFMVIYEASPLAAAHSAGVV